MRVKLFLSIVFCLFLTADFAFARKGGIRVTDANRDNIIEINDSVACMFRPQKIFAIPGTLKTRGASEFFIPRKQTINKKLKRMRERGRSESFVRRRKQKLVRAMKKLRTRCNNYRIIRRAAEAVFEDALTPDGDLNDFLELMVDLFDEGNAISSEYAEDLAILLSVFEDKEDFDNLADSHTNAKSIRQVEGSSSDSANTRVVECNEPTTHIYFVSGVDVDIFTTFMQAAMFRKYLYQESLTLSEDSYFRLWFTKEGLPSTTGGEICRLFLGPAASATPTTDNDASTDLLPSALQDVAEAYDEAFQNCLDAYGASAASIQSLTDWQTAAGAYTPNATEVNDLKEQIELDITSGRKVILVGHSQGSDLVKAVMDSLGTDGDGDFEKEAAAVSISPIATFTDSNDYGGFQYFLLDGDLGEAVTSYTQNSTNDLSSDANITPQTHRFAQHDIGLSYLRSESIAESIMSAIETLADGITNDRDFVGQGFFQVSLTWDVDGDIDLYVFEPSGTKVFYGNLTGNVGQLDRDDIPGDGPENYFVCNESSMQAGTYTVKVNNYANADANTIATIKVRGLFDTETYTVNPVGAANAGVTLIDVAEIEYDGSGNFTFTALP